MAENQGGWGKGSRPIMPADAFPVSDEKSIDASAKTEAAKKQAKPSTLMALAWAPFEFAVMCCFASVFNEAYAVWTTYGFLTTLGWSPKNAWVTGCFAGALAAALQGCVVGIWTDFLAECCFTRTPWFNAKRASLYPMRDRVVYHSHFILRVTSMFGAAFYLQPASAHSWGVVPIDHSTMDPSGSAGCRDTACPRV